MVLTSKLRLVSSSSAPEQAAHSGIPFFPLTSDNYEERGERRRRGVIYAEYRGRGSPRETIIKLESVMALMGQTRTKRSGAQRREALVVNSISR